jgi:hypothetical protein
MVAGLKLDDEGGGGRGIYGGGGGGCGRGEGGGGRGLKLDLRHSAERAWWRWSLYLQVFAETD